MNFDNNFIYECLKNDLKTTKDKVRILDAFDVNFVDKTISGHLELSLSKKDLNTSICDYVNSEEFSLLVRYGILYYSVYIKSENEFLIDVTTDSNNPNVLEDITIEEIISDDLSYFFYDSLLKAKSNIGSLGDLKSVVDALFGVKATPKGKNNTYAFILSGLDLSKSNLAGLKDQRDPVPGIDSLIISDCVNTDKDFVSKFFDKSAKIIYK